MAKADENDIEEAGLIMVMLRSMAAGGPLTLPERDAEGNVQEDENCQEFDPDDRAHCLVAVRYLLAVWERNPSAMLRVVGGMQTILFNNILDPGCDHLALHPRFMERSAEAERGGEAG